VKPYAEAIAWETSLAELKARSESRAWAIARIAVICSAVTLVALAALIPLRQVVPYVIEVDHATGETQIISVGSAETIPSPSLQAKYWVTQYVRTRERYDPSSAQIDLDAVQAWSDKAVFTEYVKRFQGSDALQHRFAEHAGWRVKVLSIGLVDNAHAVVRIERSEIRNDTEASTAPLRFTADVAFTFKPPLMGRERDLLQNPLGFQVTGYRLDPELIDVEAHP